MKSAEVYSVKELEKDLAKPGRSKEVSKNIVEYSKQLSGEYNVEGIGNVLKSISITNS